MKIVIFDTNTMGFDLDFTSFERFGEVVSYDFSTHEECIKRGFDATICISNKTQYSKELIDCLPSLKLICLTSTGTNTVDLDYAKEKGIVVSNIVGYSTQSVAQHTFSLLFYLMSPLKQYDDYVKSGDYVNDFGFSHYQYTWNDLSGKTFGIVGLGNIGRQVGTIAKCFGANVIYYSTSGSNNQTDFERVDFDLLLESSDIISIHAPLNESTRGLFNLQAFKRMKPTSIFLNLGRGAIVVEDDLAQALEGGYIGKAGIDVLSVEPMTMHHPFMQVKHKDNLFVTPHIGWASIESRHRMMIEVELNIQGFLNGVNRNQVN